MRPAPRPRTGIVAAGHEHAQSYGALGRLELAEGRLEEAEGHLQKCLALDPGNREAHYSLGLLYRRKGRSEDARRELEIAEQLRIRQTTRENPLPIGSPNGTPRRTVEGGTPAAENLRAAIQAQKKGQLAEAEQKYLEVLKTAPDLAEAHMNLGLLYHDQAATTRPSANSGRRSSWIRISWGRTTSWVSISTSNRSSKPQWLP
jgi:tetratricopeptide (TPR) repeat protein